jgi:hypothetical protein
VLSQDGRFVNNNIPSSIYEKCGSGLVLKGPKSVNEAVERELDMYRKEV